MKVKYKKNEFKKKETKKTKDQAKNGNEKQRRMRNVMNKTKSDEKKDARNT